MMKHYGSLALALCAIPATAFVVDNRKAFSPKPMTKFFDARVVPQSSGVSSLGASVDTSKTDSFGGYYSEPSSSGFDNYASYVNNQRNVKFSAREKSKYTTDSYTVRVDQNDSVCFRGYGSVVSFCIFLL
jgi:hypothetical protein